MLTILLGVTLLALATMASMILVATKTLNDNIENLTLKIFCGAYCVAVIAVVWGFIIS